MLDKLAENHKKWIAIAYNMCKCKDKANDIVQDMYLKMYEINKSVDDGYIYFVIRSIFIEEKRKQKEFTQDLETIEYLVNLDQSTDFLDTFLLQKKCYYIAYNKLQKHEKVIISFEKKMGLRNLARKSSISISLIQKTKRKLKNLIWEESQKYEELETLSRKLQKQLG